MSLFPPLIRTTLRKRKAVDPASNNSPLYPDDILETISAVRTKTDLKTWDKAIRVG